VPFLSSSNNAVLIDNCQNLQNLTVRFQVTQDLITLGNTGFSLQLNSYPQPGSLSQGSTLNWFQYIIYIVQNQALWQIQYWAIGAQPYSKTQWWPPGYAPSPPYTANYGTNPPTYNTSPWLPVFPNDFNWTSFGSAPSNQVPAGSVMEIQLTTDSNGNVTTATFSVTDPSGNINSAKFPISIYPSPNSTLYPIYGFQVDLVGPGGGLPCTFTSGAGILTYSVSPGVLSVQSGGATCGGSQPGTGESSNAVYGAVAPSTGSTVSQTLNVPPMGMAFIFDKATFGQDEVTQTPTWDSAFWLAVSGFPNSALGFNSKSNLNNTQPNPAPTVTAAINASLNNLTFTQLATIANNLPVVNTFGPPPVLAIDETLNLNFQTFMYPFTISFPNENAFNALSAHQVAIVTLTAKFTVQAPTGIDSNGNTTTTPVPVSCQANIELAKGEDPYLFNLNPTDAEAYPVWLSFDLRLFKVSPNQMHQMFSVANPTDASGAVAYIQQVLYNLNHPSLITNGDTFDNALTQDEEGSALALFPNDESFVPTFNFAVARVRINSSITTTIGPVRVFFRLFQAASTVSDFHEVGTGQGTYRWGADGSPNHKIPLLGVQTDQQGNLEYVTIPCFATERVNLNSPADMNTQHDDTNALPITTAAGKEVDTYFGCWLDVNQSTPFLIPTPPSSPSQWDGPWTGTESLNGVIAVAPHQCLIAEIRFDDAPIPDGATTATSDKLAQRNIAWLS
jgi:hypothetical protein